MSYSIMFNWFSLRLQYVYLSYPVNVFFFKVPYFNYEHIWLYFVTLFVCVALQIEVGEVVAEGTFGRVHKGVYRDPYARAALTVIIKTVTGE